MTTYTRAFVEIELIGRCGKLLTFVGKDGITKDGSNADLNGAIGSAIRYFSGTVSNPAAVADADVQTVAGSDYDALLDVAELRLLYNIRGNLDVVDTTAGPFSEKYSDIGDYLDDQIKALAKKLEDLYGVGGPEVESGVITMDIASHDEDPL